MSIPLPVFIAIPLVTAFLLPMFGKRGKDAATVVANAATIVLLVLAIICIGRYTKSVNGPSLSALISFLTASAHLCFWLSILWRRQ